MRTNGKKTTGNKDVSNEVVRTRGVPDQVVPLVLDSPHSGTAYPNDFEYQIPLEQLRLGEDTHVERLFESVVGMGGVLIDALFPRTYIDPNRARTDINADDLTGDMSERLPFRPNRRRRVIGVSG